MNDSAARVNMNENVTGTPLGSLAPVVVSIPNPGDVPTPIPTFVPSYPDIPTHTTSPYWPFSPVIWYSPWVYPTILSWVLVPGTVVC